MWYDREYNQNISNIIINGEFSHKFQIAHHAEMKLQLHYLGMGEGESWGEWDFDGREGNSIPIYETVAARHNMYLTCN